MLDLLVTNALYPTGLKFKRCDGYPNAHGCALIIPGRYWHANTDQISEALATYDWVLAFRTSDEEDLFDINKIRHPNIRWWVQSPRTGRDYGDARLFGVGFPPHFNKLPPLDRKDGVFLAAQNTHTRRQQAFEQLRRIPCVREIEETPGFTKGFARDAYARKMCHAQVAPAPSGPASPDTFRLYEALEAHAVPIADDITPGYSSAGYWRTLFPDAPFPILTNYTDLPGYINDVLNGWPANANRITAWWMRKKREMAHWLHDDLETLGAL